MIITRSPYRVSLFGGGSDIPEWYEHHGKGSVLGFALNHYCWITLRNLPPFFNHRHRIVYSKTELTKSVGEIAHPAVRAVLEWAQFDRPLSPGLELHHDGDLPARSGMGSSSAFVVGLLHAIAAFNHMGIRPRELAETAIFLEQDVMKEAVGCQDQIWAAHGGVHRIDFERGGGYTLRDFPASGERVQMLLQRLLLFFTGQQRIAAKIEAAKIERIYGSPATRERMARIVGLVDEAEAALRDPGKPLSRIGHLLHQSWQQKQGLTEDVSNSGIDAIYQAALSSGATGGKLLGAGGGGFMLLYVEPEKQASVREALRNLIEVPVGIDYEGSKVIVNER